VPTEYVEFKDTSNLWLSPFDDPLKSYNILTNMSELESLTPIPGLELREKAILEPSFTQAGVRAALTPEQSKAFDDFRELCREGGVFEEPLGLEDRDCRDGIHDDATLL